MSDKFMPGNVIIIMCSIIVRKSLVLLFFLLKTAGGLEYLIGLNDTYTVLGKPLWWTCAARRANFQEYLSYQWRFNGGSISPGHLGIVDSGNGTIFIREVQISNLGHYTCSVSDGSDSIESEAWLRQSYTSSTVSVDSISQSIRLGSDINIPCRFDAQPAASFAWFFNGNEIPESSHNIAIVHERNQCTLQITNTTYYNSGIYVCRVNHELLARSLLSQTISFQVFGKPQLDKLLTPQNVPIGRNASFRCLAQGDPHPDVVWTFTSTSSPLQTFRLSPTTISSISLGSSTISVAEDGITLNIIAAETANIGTYTCEWSNIHGSATTRSTLTVYDPPQAPVVTEPLENITIVFEGSVLELDCIGTGNPTPSIKWSIQNGEDIIQLSPSGDFHDSLTIKSNGALEVRNINREFSGRYIICSLTNTEGNSTTDTFVDVYFEPYVSNLPEYVLVEVGSKAEILCTVQGNPNPTITWLPPWRHDFDSQSDLLPLTSTFSQNGSHLVTENISQSYQGLYACQATNSVGSVVAYTSLVVLGPPIIVKPPSSIGAVENENVELICLVAGYPLPSTTWQFLPLPDPSVEAIDMTSVIQYALFDQGNWTGGSMVEMNVNPKEGVEIGDRSLIFRQAQSHDTGLYRCTAANIYGSKKAVAFLRVVTPPKFESQPRDKIVLPGDDVVLNCISSGIPVPTQRWLFNDRRINTNDRNKAHSNGSLTIHSILREEFGNYTCLVTNEYGEGLATANLRMSSKPSFESQPRNSTFIEFQRGILDCSGNSTRPFIITWFKRKADDDGFDMLGNITSLIEQSALTSESSVQSQRNTPRINIENNGSLLFNCVEMNDESWYYCQLQNEDGSIKSDTIFVNVTNSFPRQIDIEMPSSALAGASIQISCTVISSSPLSITWITPKYTEVNSSNNNLYPEVDVLPTTQGSGHSGSVLSINGLSNEKHGGKWTCKACSETGCSMAGSELSIEGHPAISDIVARKSGNDISFQCISIGIPTPDITFYLDGFNNVSSFEGHNVIGDTMTVQEAYMKNEYACTAMNSYGSSTVVSFSKPPQMIVTRLTPSKTNITIEAIVNISLPHLSPWYVVLEYKEDVVEHWQNIHKNISGSILSYLDVFESGVYQSHQSCSDVNESVERAESQDFMGIRVTSNGQYFTYLFHLQLQSLSPHTVYSIRAAIVNYVGTSIFSPVVEVLTLSSAPVPVENVTVVVLNRDARISWTFPASMNGPLEDIAVQADLFKIHNRSTARRKILPATTSNSVLTFYNLDISEYQVEIKAINELLNESSDVVSKTFAINQQVPSFVPEVIQIKSIAFYQATITWSVPPNASEAIPPITGYSLVLHPQEEQMSNIIVEIAGANTSSVTLHHLKERHVYSVRIASRNAQGVGSYSEGQTFLTAYAPFSELALGTADLDNTSWRLIAIGIVASLVPVGIFGVIVAIVIQIKLTKRGHAEITSDLNDDASVFHEQDLTESELEGVMNSNFMMY